MTAKKVAKKGTKKTLASVRIYFTGHNEKLGRKLQSVADQHGMSVSMIGVLAIRLGLPLVKKNLEGLLIDIDSQAEDHERKTSVFLES